MYQGKDAFQYTINVLLAGIIRAHTKQEVKLPKPQMLIEYEEDQRQVEKANNIKPDLTELRGLSRAYFEKK